MGEVLYINNAGKDGESHLTGNAICMSCQKEWQAVAPVGTSVLECPECKTMKGVFKHQLSPVTNSVWECNCGNKLFFILKKKIQCCNCGVITSSEVLNEI